MLAKILRRIERTINTRQAYKFFLRDWQSLGDLKECAAILSTLRYRQTLEPLEMTAPRGARIVCIAPHPDDEMMGAGGTLVRARRQGASIRCVYLTSGRPADEVEAETLTVAGRIGYQTEFLRYQVGGIPLNEDSLRRLAAAVTADRPDCLFLPFLFDDHDDHRRANQLLWQAYRQGLIGDRLEVWGYQVYSPVISNVVVDISSVAEEKGAAVRMWKSQIANRAFDHYILGLNAFNIRLLPKARYVEAFFVAPIGDYCDLCARYFHDPASAFYNPAYRS